MGYTSVISRRLFIGFTLAELLVALAILGVIAAFTIPKVISAQQNQQSKAIAKEAIAMVSAAYQQYRHNNQVTSSVGIQDLTPYMNYTSNDNNVGIDGVYTSGDFMCHTWSGSCVRLHSGALIQYWSGVNFGGTATTNGVPFRIDPDGKVTDGTTNGPGKALDVYLYTDGLITDEGNMRPNTTYDAGGPTIRTPCPSCVPPWFQW